MTREIPISLSSKDISEIVDLLNKLLKKVSLLTLSSEDLSCVELNKMPGFANRKFPDVVETINRFGIRDDSGSFYKLLNDVIGRITLHNPMFQIYDSVKLLLFNKLLERWTDRTAVFTQAELEVYFLQPFIFMNTTHLYSALFLDSQMLFKIEEIRNSLKSEDAQDFLQYGISRRLFMLKANVDSIMEHYHRNRTEGLSQEEDIILDQNINAFYANIYAIIDCIAFVIAFEDDGCNIQRDDKSDLNKVGLFNRNFPKIYKEYELLESQLNLRKLKVWFDEICDLRHPVAHRIPLYFPNIYNDKEAEIYENSIQKYNNEYRKLCEDGVSPEEFIKISTELNKRRDEELSRVNLFSGCFLHSDAESKQSYHLSRLTLDVGILCYLLYRSFDYIEELIKGRQANN